MASERINVRCNQNTRKAFKLACTLEKTTMSKNANTMINEWTDSILKKHGVTLTLEDQAVLQSSGKLSTLRM